MAGQAKKGGMRKHSTGSQSREMHLPFSSMESEETVQLSPKRAISNGDIWEHVGDDAE